MDMELQRQIIKLQREIEQEEDKINAYKLDDRRAFVKKNIAIIQSDLKYLSIIVNGVPMEPQQNTMIREFVRVHYENLWRIPLSAI